MKAVLFFICGIFLANIVVATFIWPPTTTASGTPAPVVNAATLQGQDPWMVNERYDAPSRERTRKATLETLDKPWASYCTTEGPRASDPHHQQLLWAARCPGVELRTYVRRGRQALRDQGLDHDR